MFCAQVDASKAVGIHGLDHEHEDIRVFALPFAEAFSQWEVGKMPNSPATIGLLWLKVYRSEEHTSELQSLMRISYAVFYLKKKKQDTPNKNHHQAEHNKEQDNTNRP